MEYEKLLKKRDELIKNIQKLISDFERDYTKINNIDYHFITSDFVNESDRKLIISNLKIDYSVADLENVNYKKIYDIQAGSNGGIVIAEYKGKYYWAIDDYTFSLRDINEYQEISKELYDEILKNEQN